MIIMEFHNRRRTDSEKLLSIFFCSCYYFFVSFLYTSTRDYTYIRIMLNLNYLTDIEANNANIGTLTCYWRTIPIVLLTDFGHGDQSQRRLAICAEDIIVHKCVRRHRCTLCSFTLIIRWDGNPTRPERDQAQDQRLNVLSETRGYHTANFQTPGYYWEFPIRKTQ